MNSEETIHQPRTGNSTRRSLKWSGLQARMTISYVWVTIVLGLVSVFLAWLVFAFVVFTFAAPFVYTLAARETAGRYTLAAALQADASGLNPRATFLPHQLGSLTLPGQSSSSDDAQVPYIATDRPGIQPLTFALLITPDSRVLASSYPKRYPTNTPVAVLLPQRAGLIAHALSGTAASGADNDGIYAVETVWSRDRQPIGALYVQLPGAPSLADALGHWPWQPLVPVAIMSGLILLVMIAPIGGFFGLMTTRGVVRRIRHLVIATTRFAEGTYTQRVSILRQDEIGELERQFNRMATQLAESIAQQQKLSEQNARLAERERISRELHDAISQDLFSLRMLAGGLESAVANGSDLHPYIETLEQATDGMLRDMRALLLELRPVQLEELGLARALEELALTYSTRLGINVSATIQTVSLPEQVQHTLFRIAQEALTNAVRHAGAASVTLALRSSQDQVELVITDNGKGFEQTEERGEHGLGLGLMQERVQELRGILSIHSILGEGTRIAVSLPQENVS